MVVMIAPCRDVATFSAAGTHGGDGSRLLSSGLQCRFRQWFTLAHGCDRCVNEWQW